MFRYLTTISLFFTFCVYAMEKENLFDLLPLDLHSKISKDVFSLVIRESSDSDGHRDAVNQFFGRTAPTEHIDPKVLNQYLLNIPIPLAIAVTHEFHQLQNLCQQEIGGKNFVAQELFVLPREEREVFVRMANRGLLKWVSEGDLSIEDYEIIKAMESKNIKKGLDLRLLHGNKVTSYTRLVGVGGIYLACALVFIGIPINYLKNTYVCYLIGSFGLGGASLFGVSVILELCGYGAFLQEKRF